MHNARHKCLQLNEEVSMAIKRINQILYGVQLFSTTKNKYVYK